MPVIGQVATTVGGPLRLLKHILTYGPGTDRSRARTTRSAGQGAAEAAPDARSVNVARATPVNVPAVVEPPEPSAKPS
jgi:hypothetical protein